jgi:predicted MFS family arabinose efflux permease
LVAGRRIWIVIWYGILLLGILGFWASIYWGRQTHWKNLDELLRACGTIAAAVGMLLLLYGSEGWAGEALLLVALVFFGLAFLFGRRRTRLSQAAQRESTPEVPIEPPPRNRA